MKHERHWPRWRSLVAGILNRGPTCWADLVCWMTGVGRLRDAFKGCPGCKRDAKQDGACWCGKYGRKDGDHA